MNADVINFVYVAAAILFIFGLKLLGSPATARKGNLISATGMLVAVIVTLLDQGILQYQYIIAGMAIGGLIGAVTARVVAMTSMPEMVALFNGFGGLASLFVGWAALSTALLAANVQPVAVFTLVTIFLSILIGGLTFTGSVLAYGKLSERISGRPFVYVGQRFVNGAILLAVVVCAVLFIQDSSDQNWLYLAVILSLLLGVMFVLPIGGADMPVVISLLNSFSGIAAAAAGFARKTI